MPDPFASVLRYVNAPVMSSGQSIFVEFMNDTDPQLSVRLPSVDAPLHGLVPHA
jgi:hypothetical protein